jgi:predicted DNA-binding transcriptional regulator AlpA
VSKLLDKPFLTTAEVAEVLCTNDSTIRASRCSGVLYGRPAPEPYQLGDKKILYKTEDLLAWIESAPKRRVTDNPEPVP